MTPETRQSIVQRAPGIYFGLDEDEYHSDLALGSTDIRKLAADPENFWFGSRFNPTPDESEETSEAMEVGKAMHLCVLEGAAALERRYAQVVHPGNIKAGINERAEVKASGRIPIKAKYWRRIVVAAEMIKANPHLGSAFENAIAKELSIFWVDAKGLPRKARFDALKMRATVDLKSIVNRDFVPFYELCRKHVATYRYDVQAACYIEARAEMAALIKKGAIFGPHGEHIDDFMLNERLSLAANERAAFIFVFVQKNGAPLTLGISLSPGNGILDLARNEVETAQENWLYYVERFGLDKAWLTCEPIEEAQFDDYPTWGFKPSTRRQYLSKTE